MIEFEYAYDIPISFFIFLIVVRLMTILTNVAKIIKIAPPSIIEGINPIVSSRICIKGSNIPASFMFVIQDIIRFHKGIMYCVLKYSSNISFVAVSVSSRSFSLSDVRSVYRLIYCLNLLLLIFLIEFFLSRNLKKSAGSHHRMGTKKTERYISSPRVIENSAFSKMLSINANELRIMYSAFFLCFDNYARATYFSSQNKNQHNSKKINDCLCLKNWQEEIR